jgi:hypothetical protein
VRPVHVASYIEQLQALRKAPTVKQHLACIRMWRVLFLIPYFAIGTFVGIAEFNLLER